MPLVASRLGQHLLGGQQAELDADTREADALAAHLGAGRDVVVSGQLAPPHADAVVDDDQQGIAAVGADGDPRGARVERIGDDLREDRLLQAARIGVPQVLEEVQEVDARLAHRAPRIAWATPGPVAPADQR